MDVFKKLFINDHYPVSDEMFSEKQVIDVIPQLLQLLLSDII